MDVLYSEQENFPNSTVVYEPVYSYFKATRGTVKLLSRGSGEDLGNLPEAKGRGQHFFSTTEGQWFDCSPSSIEITVLLPNCFKSPKHCRQYADARRLHRDI